MSQEQYFCWYNLIQSGQTTNNEEPRSGYPLMSRNDAHVKSVDHLVQVKQRLTVRESANEVDNSVELKSGHAGYHVQIPEHTSLNVFEGHKQHTSDSPATPLPRSCSCRLLSIPKVETHFETQSETTEDKNVPQT
ncbi:hypothetical protein J437_LFUL010513 [Ladona fulva]|uniref:Uncharacterized protein n=1 Tax=Ladona fulva TaxID=123851 RepID=A0A8K0KDR6_LADFU|nr:hypothetical protein J437_LFUL010513 [Ladona fulva]